MGRGFVKIGSAETDSEDIAWRRVLGAGRAAIYSGNYGLVILDEINTQSATRCWTAERWLEALKKRPEQVTSFAQDAMPTRCWVEEADLVTEMKEVKHPYTKGILAQRGIDY